MRFHDAIVSGGFVKVIIIVLAKWDRDPRQFRVVTRGGELLAFEVCELDALGQPAWRGKSQSEHACDKFSRAALLTLALHAMCLDACDARSGARTHAAPRIETLNGVCTVDVGTVRP